MTTCPNCQNTLLFNSQTFSALQIDTLLEKDQKIYLTKTQFEVLKLLVTGKNNSEIASILFVGKRTIESHIYKLLMVFGLKNRLQLALACFVHPENIFIATVRLWWHS